MKAHEFTAQAGVDVPTLEAWLDAGWLKPRRNREGPHYSEIDLARAHLIADLGRLGINSEGVTVILDLMD